MKIHPTYQRGQAIYVTDASRAVGVVSALLSPASREQYVETIRGEYRKVADAHARSEADKQRLPIERARANAMKLDWQTHQPPKPAFLGRVRLIDDEAYAQSAVRYCTSRLMGYRSGHGAQTQRCGPPARATCVR